MLLTFQFSRKIANTLAATVLTIILLTIFTLYHNHSSAVHAPHRLSSLSSSIPDSSNAPPRQNLAQTDLELQLPLDYRHNDNEETTFCADRFGTRYITNLRDHSYEYCDTKSTSSLTCFHSSTASSRIDTFCLGKAAIYNLSSRKFTLNCDTIDQGPGVLNFENFASYWYDTGPKVVFNHAVELSKPVATREAAGLIRAPAPQDFTVLLKREGEGNIWHCLMEIISLTMTFDVLQMSRGPKTSTGKPLFTIDHISQTQVVVIDDKTDGPYFDLWRLFAQKPVLRLKDLTNSTPTNIIIPLAGGGNPFWQGDWDVLSCDQSTVLKAFTTRVFTFLQVEATASDKIVVTIVNRVEGRRLVDQDTLVEAARKRLNSDRVQLQLIDLAALPFKGQVELIRGSDVLIGVHGAGLTHGMWLHTGSVMVEILPQNLNHKGFRNLASMLGHRYFSAHAGVPPLQRRDWHGDDVFIEVERYVDLVELAVKTVFNKGVHNLDAV